MAEPNNWRKKEQPWLDDPQLGAAVLKALQDLVVAVNSVAQTIKKVT